MSTIFGGAIPPNSGNFNGVTGNDFVVNHTGNSTGGWWFRPAGSPVAQVTMGLYKTLAAPVLLTSKNQAGMVAGAWNFIPWNAAVALTPGEVYTIAAYDHDGQIAWTPSALDNQYIYNSPFTALNQGGRVVAAPALTFPTGFFRDAYGVDTEFVLTEPCAPCPPCPPTTGFLINLTSPGFISAVTGVGQCIVEALDQTPAGAPCRRCLLLPTASIPWDNCGCPEGLNDCSGQVALAIRQIYGADTYPAATIRTYRKCNHRYEVAEVVASVTRCVPALDAAGNAPSCAAELAAAVTLEHDRTAVRQAIACCLNAANQARPDLVSEWSIGPSMTVGELGGCAGVETTFYIGVQSCLCPN